MIGYLVTGHGEFSKGLMSSLNMIAGEQDGVTAINFEENANLEKYQETLKEKVVSLLNENEGVLIFTDLLGGTPFRIAMLVADEFENVEVMTGTNLPMLLEGTALRFTDDVKEVANQLVESGKTGVTNPRLDLDEEDEQEASFEGGI